MNLPMLRMAADPVYVLDDMWKKMDHNVLDQLPPDIEDPGVLPFLNRAAWRHTDILRTDLKRKETIYEQET